MTQRQTPYNPSPTYLRTLLAKAGLSQQRAARILGINDRLVRHYLTGRDKATYEFQAKLEDLAENPPQREDYHPAVWFGPRWREILAELDG